MLKNQVSRQRQEFEETTEDLRKELAIKKSAILCQKSQNELVTSSSVEKISSFYGERPFSSENEKPKNSVSKNASDIEVGRQNNIILSFMHFVIYQDINNLFIL